MASKSYNMKAIGKLCEGKPRAQFDEGTLETEILVRSSETLARKGRNGQGSQDRRYPPRLRPTLLLMCFERWDDAKRVFEALPKRFGKHGLELHPEKTRLVAFGRSVLWKVEKEGGKPDTFDFLGFTHMCARSRRGYFTIHVSTMKSRLKRSLSRISQWCRKNRHKPVEKQWEKLNEKMRGHYAYYGRPTNYKKMWKFHRSVRRIWKKWLNSRTRGNRLNWEKYAKLLNKYPLARPYITRAWAN